MDRTEVLSLDELTIDRAARNPKDRKPIPHSERTAEWANDARAANASMAPRRLDTRTSRVSASDVVRAQAT